MGSFSQGALVEQRTTTATAGGTTTLTSASLTLQKFTGTANQIVKLPDATTMKNGRRFEVINRSTGTLTIQLNDNSVVDTVLADSEKTIYLFDNSSTNGTWEISTGVDQTAPLKVYATVPTPDSKLNIAANVVMAEDGSSKSVAPSDGAINTYPFTTVDFQTGAVTGGTVTRNSGAFTLPTTTIGNFRRVCFTYVNDLTRVDCAFSAEAASVAALDNAGVIFSTLDGVPMGYIDLEATAATAYKTAGSATNVIESSVGGVSRIFRFGNGSGGSGTGNASEITETVRNMLDTLGYNLATPVDFALVKNNLTDPASTGSYTNRLFELGVGTTFVSKALTDSELGSAPSVLGYVDLMAFWNVARTDTAATYQVSRDDGVEYQTVTMTRIGTTNAFQGELKFAEEAVKQTLSSQTVGAVNFPINVTTAQRIAQTITLASPTVIKNVDLKAIRTGSAIGFLKVAIVRNNAGVPSNLVSDTIAETTVGYDIAAIPTAATVISVPFPATALAAGTYHVVVSTSGYASTYSAGVTQVALLTDTAVNGMSTYDGTSFADSAANGAYCVVTGSVLALRVKVTGAQASKALAGVGIFYDRSYNGISKGVENYERADFKSVSGNLSTFTMAKFLPNQKFLRVYHVQKAQVMVWPSFSISGYQVIFPADTFKNDGVETDVTLIFDQSVGQADSSDANASNIALLQSGSAETNDKVVLSKLTAINGSPGAGQFRSSIAGRAQMTDLSNDLLPRLGVERIQTQQLMKIDGEVGPAGENVYKPVNDKYDQIRMCGQWSSANNGSGQYSNTSGVGTDFYEISFYGTGLNILATDYDSTGRDARATVDGGSEGSNFLTTPLSAIINGRLYSQNIVVPVVSGLPQGIHTVKIRNVNWLRLSGIEILNEASVGGTNNPCAGNITNASNQLTSLSNVAGIVAGMVITGTGIPLGTTVSSISGTTVTMSANATATTVGLQVAFTGAVLRTPPGSAVIDGMKRTLSAVDYQMYNTGFESGALGTRGGRAVMYMKADGTIKKSFNPAGSQLNLTAADHSNEEVIRAYNWREFGAGRTDDFSTLTTANSARAFTLGDGTTTLAGDSVYSLNNNSVDCFTVNSTNNYFTFTFVGTGLDIVASSPSGRPVTITVDGVVITTNTSLSSFGTVVPVKIVSGLPYGTHTVKVLSTTSGTFIASNFIVYGPKKPTIPSGAMELADYNVMADFVANATAESGRISTGVLRKMGTREAVYSGTWDSVTTLDALTEPGFYIRATANASYVEYTFFGTGFDLKCGAASNGDPASQLTLDGSTNFTAYTTSYYGTGIVFTPSTGVLDQLGSGGYGVGVVVSGLPLGVHKLRMAKTSGTYIYAYAIDIITPIHVHKNNGPFVLQNTLAIGSQGINDGRKFGSQLLASKNVSQVTGVSGTLQTLTSAGTYFPINDIVTTIKTNGGALKFGGAINHYTDVYGVLGVYVDGILAQEMKGLQGGVTSPYLQGSLAGVYPVQAGWHTIQVFYKLLVGGSSNFNSNSEMHKLLTVEELPIG